MPVSAATEREWAIVTADGKAELQQGHSLEDALKAYRKGTSNPLKVLAVIAADIVIQPEAISPHTFCVALLKHHPKGAQTS